MASTGWTQNASVVEAPEPKRPRLTDDVGPESLGDFTWVIDDSLRHHAHEVYVVWSAVRVPIQMPVAPIIQQWAGAFCTTHRRMALRLAIPDIYEVREGLASWKRAGFQEAETYVNPQGYCLSSESLPLNPEPQGRPLTLLTSNDEKEVLQFWPRWIRLVYVPHGYANVEARTASTTTDAIMTSKWVPLGLKRMVLATPFRHMVAQERLHRLAFDVLDCEAKFDCSRWRIKQFTWADIASNKQYITRLSNLCHPHTPHDGRYEQDLEKKLQEARVILTAESTNTGDVLALVVAVPDQNPAWEWVVTVACVPRSPPTPSLLPLLFVNLAYLAMSVGVSALRAYASGPIGTKLSNAGFQAADAVWDPRGERCVYGQPEPYVHAGTNEQRYTYVLLDRPIHWPETVEDRLAELFRPLGPALTDICRMLNHEIPCRRTEEDNS